MQGALEEESSAFEKLLVPSSVSGLSGKES